MARIFLTGQWAQEVSGRNPRRLVMKSFLFGLGLGLGLGVLFAPSSGEEIRNNIAQRANDFADQARDTIVQCKKRVRSGITAIRNVAQQQGVEIGEPRTGTEGGV